jgi:hypothetical protein
MGLFLALSGVIGAEATDVKNALSDFAQSQNGGLELAEGTTDDPNIGVISRNGPNTTVVYPYEFFEWDDASKFLSEKLRKPVFSLHIHDEDLWMFVLFLNGKEIDWFNPVPEYWEDDLPIEEKKRWKGNTSLIAGLIPSVNIDAIAKYLVEWNLDDEDPKKAYSDDEFTNCDCWQMCDFMKKIGLEYPIGNDGSIHGDTFRFWIKET